MSLLGAGRIEEAVAPALAAAGDAVMVTCIRSIRGLTRFASSRIHQNVWSEATELRVAVVADGDRLGVVSTSALDDESVRRAAAAALEIARASQPLEGFPGFAGPAEYPHGDLYDDATASATPADRARTVAGALEALGRDMDGAGFHETGETETLIAATTGLRAYAAATRAAFSMMTMTSTSSGFAEATARRLSALDAQELTEHAARKADRGRHPDPIEPGRHTVVLEPAATATLLDFLAYMGLGAKELLEGRSFMEGRIGERICDERVTIADDPMADGAMGLPFDYEGTPARAHVMIDRGVARDVAWDRTTARRAGRESTGHGLPLPNTHGPMALNLLFAPGDHTVDELIGSTERGLLVTRFHYSNVLNQKDTTITGMTRDGTFRIENGEVGRPVRNLRFTQSVLEALSNVEGVGHRTELTSELFFSGSRAPALKVAGFNFSSATTH